MPKRRSPATLSRKLAAYAGAGGVVLVSNGAVKADLVYTPENVVVTPGQSVPVDVDGNGTAEFNFNLYSSSTGSPPFGNGPFGGAPNGAELVSPDGTIATGIVSSPYTATNISGGPTYLADALLPGQTISAASTFHGVSPAPFSSPPGTKSPVYVADGANSNFAGQGTRYLGVEFTGSDAQTHYGFVGVNLAGDLSKATITGWGYNTTAGAAVTIPGHVTAMPEPSSLAMMAMGAPCVAVLLRRRRAEAAAPAA